MNDKPPVPFMDTSRQEFAIITLCCLPVPFIVGAIAGDGRGLVAGMGVATIACAIRFSWPLRQQYWFWCTIGAIAALHLLALIMFDWRWAADWGKAETAVVVYADLGLDVGAIYAVYRIICGVPRQLVEDNPSDLPSYGERDINL